MKDLLTLLLLGIIVAQNTIGQTKPSLEPENLLNKADSLFKVFRYDSASVSYHNAAIWYEKKQDWLNCVKNYRLTSNALVKAAKYDSALFYIQKAMNIAEKNFYEGNKVEMFEKSEIFLSYNDVYEKKGKFIEELKDCKNALELILKTDSTDSLKIAKIWNKTGVAYDKLGKLDSALLFLEKAFHVRIKLLGENHVDVAESYFSMGKVYDNVAQYDKALEYQLKALKIRLFALGEMHPDVAASYNNIGIIYWRKGEYDKALEYHQKSLKIQISTLGETHPDVAGSYNNIGIVYRKKGEYDKTLEYYQKAVKIRISAFGEAHLDVANSYNNIGLVYYSKGLFDKALEFYQKALKIYSSITAGMNPYLANSYDNIGIIYYEKGEYDKALEFYQKALTIRIQIFGEMHPHVASTYNSIGVVYDEKGEYDKALEYHLKSLKIQISTLGEMHPDVADSYNNIGVIYHEKGDNDKALEYYQKVLKIRISVFGEIHPDVATNYNNIGNIYYDKGEYDKALEYHLKALKIRNSALGEMHPDVTVSYNNIGMIYEKKREYDKALEYHLKALKILTTYYSDMQPNIASTFFNIGIIYDKKRDYETALEFYQKALLANLAGFNDSSVYSNPKLINILSEPFLVSSLTQKAEALYQLYRNKTNSNRDIEASISTYELAFQLINNMRNKSNSESTKLLLSETTKNSFINAVRAAMQLNKVSRLADNNSLTFEFIEKCKSATLAARSNDYDAKHFAGIPDSLVKMEKNIEKKINDFTTEIDKEKYTKDGYDTLKVNSLEKENFTCSRELDSLIISFEKNYPAYYELKYLNKIASIPEIKESLDRQTALINYFIGDSSLFIATITDSLFNIQEIKIDNTFKNTVINYYKDIKTAETDSFISNNQHLYEKLIKPVKGFIAHKEHLIIIPDDYLYYIPFETLIDNNSSITPQNIDYYKLEYLIKAHSITYNHSATVWYNSKKKETGQVSKLKGNFIGFAPVFNKENNNGMILSCNINAFDTTEHNLAYRSLSTDMKRFNPLPYSKEEVTSIVHLFEKRKKEAKAYLYSAANESNFKNNADNFSYVHISSHGFANDKEPRLSGLVLSQPTDTLDKEDGILYAGETYSLNLKADLIVLSSCESGVGKLIKGEGLQALSRGFLYAGTPNVMFSLWKALDKPTKDLMVEFYSHVLDGKSYAEALRQAKLSLIKDSKTAFPHFWGGFVLVGK